jgi:hypothetical protein
MIASPFRLAAPLLALILLAGSTAWAQEAAPAPEGHPFAKIEAGMVQEQVRDILGEPTSRFNYTPGTRWIPWNMAMGRDQQRYEWYYKGSGVVIFSSRGYWAGITVLRVDYDPSEDGYH